MKTRSIVALAVSFLLVLGTVSAIDETQSEDSEGLFQNIFSSLQNLLNSNSNLITGQFSGSGAGTATNPYEISNCEELQTMENDLLAHYELVSDIDCSSTNESGHTLNNEGHGFRPIGYPEKQFKGYLDGNGHVVRNLYIDRFNFDENDKNYAIGLIGYLKSNDISSISGKVENVGLVNATIKGSYSVGALVGNNFGIIENSFSTGKIASKGYGGAGGIYGTGGNGGGEVIESYSIAKVEGGADIGGLVGGYGHVANGFSVGSVSGESNTGGVIGGNHSSDIVDSYWDTQKSGQSRGAGSAVGLNTSEMKGDSASENMKGLNFSSEWEEVKKTDNDTISDSYPVLTSIPRSKQLEARGILKESSLIWDSVTLSPDVLYSGYNLSVETSASKTDGDVETLELKIYQNGSEVFNEQVNEGSYAWNEFYQVQQGTIEAEVTAVSEEGSEITRTVQKEVNQSNILYGGGRGISGDPYLIENWEHLHHVRNNKGSHFVLAKDLDNNTKGYDEYASPNANSGKGFKPIGSFRNPFRGWFDGEGHVIENLYINRSKEKTALFAIVENPGMIEKVGVVNASVTGKKYSGILVGWLDIDAYVRDSFTTGAVNPSADVDKLMDNYVESGGLVGTNDEGNIFRSFSHADVNANNNPGGLVGDHYNYDAVISESYSTGNITGWVWEDYTKNDNFGLIGVSDASPETSNSYYDVNSTGPYPESGGGTGLTTSQMTYPNAEGNMSFDFSDEWTTCEGVNQGYPYQKVFEGTYFQCDEKGGQIGVEVEINEGTGNESLSINLENRDLGAVSNWDSEGGVDSVQNFTNSTLNMVPSGGFPFDQKINVSDEAGKTVEIDVDFDYNITNLSENPDYSHSLEAQQVMKQVGLESNSSESIAYKIELDSHGENRTPETLEGTVPATRDVTNRAIWQGDWIENSTGNVSQNMERDSNLSRQYYSINRTLRNLRENVSFSNVNVSSEDLTGRLPGNCLNCVGREVDLKSNETNEITYSSMADGLNTSVELFNITDRVELGKTYNEVVNLNITQQKGFDLQNISTKSYLEERVPNNACSQYNASQIDINASSKETIASGFDCKYGGIENHTTISNNGYGTSESKLEVFTGKIDDKNLSTVVDKSKLAKWKDREGDLDVRVSGVKEHVSFSPVAEGLRVNISKGFFWDLTQNNTENNHVNEGLDVRVVEINNTVDSGDYLNLTVNATNMNSGNGSISDEVQLLNPEDKVVDNQTVSNLKPENSTLFNLSLNTSKDSDYVDVIEVRSNDSSWFEPVNVGDTNYSLKNEEEYNPYTVNVTYGVNDQDSGGGAEVGSSDDSDESSGDDSGGSSSGGGAPIGGQTSPSASGGNPVLSENGESENNSKNNQTSSNDTDKVENDTVQNNISTTDLQSSFLSENRTTFEIMLDDSERDELFDSLWFDRSGSEKVLIGLSTALLFVVSLFVVFSGFRRLKDGSVVNSVEGSVQESVQEAKEMMEKS